MMQRLHPSPAGPVESILDAYRAERLRHPDGRPWVGVCMVASLDGSTVVNGRSVALSSENDTAVLVALRRLAGAILVGAGTVRGEGYGPPSTPGQRIGVVTNSGTVDIDTELFTSGAGFVICPRSAPRLPVETLRAGDEVVDLAEALCRFDEIAPDALFVQAEGGSMLNGGLAEQDLIDELNLTVSPHLVGGDGPRLTTGAPERIRAGFDLAHLLIDEHSFLFTRWVRREPRAG